MSSINGRYNNFLCVLKPLGAIWGVLRERLLGRGWPSSGVALFEARFWGTLFFWGVLGMPGCLQYKGDISNLVRFQNSFGPVGGFPWERLLGLFWASSWGLF